jgi:hypothetical protein
MAFDCLSARSVIVDKLIDDFHNRIDPNSFIHASRFSCRHRHTHQPMMDPWSTPLLVLRNKIMMEILLVATIYPNRMTATNLTFSRWKILPSKFSPAACGPVRNCRSFLNDYRLYIRLWEVGHCAEERNGKMVCQWTILCKPCVRRTTNDGGDEVKNASAAIRDSFRAC